MQISEVFDSIQGEGPWIGQPATFVRLHGCNLCCSFCDTPYSKNGSYTEIPAIDVADMVIERFPHTVVFTGGEPTLQMAALEEVISRIRNAHPLKRIAIETNGTREIKDGLFDAIVVSPKSMSVVSRWCNIPNVYIKFLAIDEHDIENIRRQIGTNIFANIPYVMPIGVTAEQMSTTGKEISDLIISYGMDVILSPRLHILMGIK